MSSHPNPLSRTSNSLHVNVGLESTIISPLVSTPTNPTSVLTKKQHDEIVSSSQELEVMANASETNEKKESLAAVSTEENIAVFSAVVSMVNSDGQLIWNRYNAMLAANSFFAGLLALMVAKGISTTIDALIVLVGSFLGLYLTWQWRGLTKRGWELQHYWVKYAESFKWNNLKNPYEPYTEWCKKTGRGEGLADWIAVYARRVINLFLFGYCITSIIALGFIILRFFHVS